MRKISEQFNQIYLHIKEKLWSWMWREDKKEQDDVSKASPVFPDNPCIPYMRTIIEKLLAKRNIAYRDFYLVLIDRISDISDKCSSGMYSEKPEEYQEAIWLEQRNDYLDGQLDAVLGQLALGLNRIQIRTDRAEYFEDFAGIMYEENGLIVQLEGKEARQFPDKCVVVDFETEGLIPAGFLREDIIYLPIYKKRWEIAQNLDITVPIGYNTVIVKGAIQRIKVLYPDKLEREFYDS